MKDHLSELLKFDWDIPNRLRADALHKSVLDWGTLTAAADEIERLRSEVDRLNRFVRDCEELDTQ